MRLGAHATLVGVVSFITVFMMEGSGGSQIMGVVFIMVISLFTVTLFVSFHADVSEGILISMFVEEKFTDNVKRPPAKVTAVYE